MNKKEFNSFFKIHSQNVDNSNKLGFWELTDRILKTYLLENIPRRENVTIVDFGGGTGRWLLMLDQYFRNSKFIIVDLSEDMLSQAKKKVSDGLYRNQVDLISGDITDVSHLCDGIADYVISTYNPISFVKDPQCVINEAFRILKQDGKALITVQGYYNALYSKINNSLADSKELNEIYNKKKVKWNNSVPKLWQLSKNDMESMFVKSGFSEVISRGIACVTQPQGEDFDPENKQLGPLSKKLNEDSLFYDTLFNIELKTGEDQNAVDRGMNILTIGRKL